MTAKMDTDVNCAIVISDSLPAKGAAGTTAVPFYGRAAENVPRRPGFKAHTFYTRAVFQIRTKIRKIIKKLLTSKKF